jgi:hypothetical protein
LGRGGFDALGALSEQLSQITGRVMKRIRSSIRGGFCKKKAVADVSATAPNLPK